MESQKQMAVSPNDVEWLVNFLFHIHETAGEDSTEFIKESVDSENNDYLREYVQCAVQGFMRESALEIDGGINFDTFNQTRDHLVEEVLKNLKKKISVE